MKFYRAVFYTFKDGSAGYSWHTSRAEADKVIREYQKKYTEEEDASGSKVEEINIIPTKAGILAALNRYADHADNG